ncbi:MAG: hypothetical protein ACPG32_06565 [Akkermansiaceae bacterium]
MNAPTLILTSLGLGVMVGITGTHFQQVRTIVEQGAPAPAPVEQPYVYPEERPADIDKVDTPSHTAEPIMLANRTTPEELIAKANNGSDPKLINTLMEMITEMRREQKSLHRQLSEANRDIHDLTFQMDAQSSEFRPLRTGAQRPKRMEAENYLGVPDSDGVLPGKQ